MTTKQKALALAFVGGIWFWSWLYPVIALVNWMQFPFILTAVLVQAALIFAIVLDDKFLP